MASFKGGDGNDSSFFCIVMVDHRVSVVELNYSQLHALRTYPLKNGKTGEEVGALIENRDV